MRKEKIFMAMAIFSEIINEFFRKELLDQLDLFFNM